MKGGEGRKSFCKEGRTKAAFGQNDSPIQDDDDGFVVPFHSSAALSLGRATMSSAVRRRGGGGGGIRLPRGGDGASMALLFSFFILFKFHPGDAESAAAAASAEKKLVSTP